MKFFCTISLLVLTSALNTFSQNGSHIQDRYLKCFDSLELLLKNNGSFKKAVFLVENCYLSNQMKYENFSAYINQFVSLIRLWQQYNPLAEYSFKDSVNFAHNYAIYRCLKDTIKLMGGNGDLYFHLPYIYDFNDFSGREDWSNMFVSKLLSSHSGNCHSLPYLYKILADELNASCWLATAPNHLYIKNRCKESGWYNTELTSGAFPIDAWITTSGYVSLQAIQNGIYMDTLSNQQSISLCVLDLAKGYEFQLKDYADGFILNCCDLVLQYHPVNVQALLLKAETYRRLYDLARKRKSKEQGKFYDSMEQLYVKLYELGYREMPDKMYKQWLLSLKNERMKFQNKLHQNLK